jgi:hypothetical protein
MVVEVTSPNLKHGQGKVASCSDRGSKGKSRDDDVLMKEVEEEEPGSRFSSGEFL